MSNLDLFVDTVLENIVIKKEIYMSKINDLPNYVVIPDNILDILIDTYKKTIEKQGDKEIYSIFGMKVIGTPIKTKIEEIEVL